MGRERFYLPAHATAREARSIVGKDVWETSFAIVRNPFERFLSMWKYICRATNPEGYREKENGFEWWLENGRNSFLIGDKWRPQEIWCRGVEKVFKLENINAIENHISNILGKPIILPKRNSSFDKSRVCEHYKNETLIKKIQQNDSWVINNYYAELGDNRCPH